MGACNIFVQFVLGPFLVYGLFLGHVTYQMSKTPEDLQMPAWPAQTSKAEKEAIIQSRKPIIDGMMDLAAAKNPDFASKFCTEDIEYEDPIQKIAGFKDFDGMIKFLHRFIKHSEFDIHGEHHSTHEIVLDWTITVQHKMMSGIKLPLYLRTHLLLEPPAKKGGSEIIFKMFDEWGGNPFMTEKNTVPAWLGRTHSTLRIFHGYLMTKLFDLFR